MTLDKKTVNITLKKLPLNVINILLVACDPNYNLSPEDEANSSRKTLTINRERLAQVIVERDDTATYTKAEEIANSISQMDSDINTTKEELKPIEQEYKDKKANLKRLKEEKEALLKVKADELAATLSEEDAAKITNYHSDLEKARAELSRQKQREKGLKAYAQGLMVSLMDDMEEEYEVAAQEIKASATKTAAKYLSQVEEEKVLDLNTTEGLKAANQAFSEALKIPMVRAINQAKLNPEWKNNQDMGALAAA